MHALCLASARSLVSGGELDGRQSGDISGTISATRIIVDDSQLVGNVTCTTTTSPCIQFGAPNIALRLKGIHDHGTCEPRRHDDLPGRVGSSGRGWHRQRHGGRQQPARGARSSVPAWCRISGGTAS